MKAFVTGATGFIGTNLIHRLLKDGWQVKALVRDERKFRLPNHQNLELIKGNLTDQVGLNQGSKEVDVVFNLAAVLPYHRLSEGKYIQANVTGVENLLKAAFEAGVDRLVHVSTVGIYGPSAADTIDEQSKVSIKDVYSETKYKGELLIRSFAEKTGLQFVIIRPTIAYGPYDTRPGFLDLFRFIKKRLFFLVGDGGNFFHTIYVENLVDALLLAATKKQTINEDFIIGDEDCPSMKDIAQTIAEVEDVSLNPFYLPKWFALLLAKIPGIPLTNQRVNFITENRRYSIKKAKKILNYKPRYNLSEGIKKTYDWYLKKGYL